MLPLLIRGIIIYTVLIASVRIMGKRQIGELQPSELVITILLSQIASMPIENGETPLLGCIISIILLVSLEVISSVFIMKFSKMRSLIQGNSVVIIEEGKVVEKNLKKLRLTIEDLMEALRLKDVFDIKSVYMAYIETNGSLSVKLKNENETISLKDVKIKKEDNDYQCLVISDGRYIEKEFIALGLSKEKISKILKDKGLQRKEILIMTYAKNGSNNIILKEK